MFENIKHPLITSAKWQTIALGSSNQIFQANIEGQSLILRINASCEFAFGVEREREAKVLALIDKCSWAPIIIENNLGEGWCLMHDHGCNLPVHEQSKKRLLIWLAQLQLFSQKVDKETAKNIEFDYSQLLTSYKQQLQPIRYNQSALSLCQLIAQRLQHFPKVPSCLMHQDLHPQNICYTTNIDQEFVVIDWEYSGWGTPWLDAAALHNSFEIERDSLHQLPLFKSLSEVEFSQGLQLALAINAAFACIWYWVRCTFDVKEGYSKAIHQQITVPAELEKQAQLCITQLTILRTEIGLHCK